MPIKKKYPTKNILSNRIIERQRTRTEWKITNDCCLLFLKLYAFSFHILSGGADLELMFPSLLLSSCHNFLRQEGAKLFIMFRLEMNPKENAFRQFIEVCRGETFSFLKREKITNCRWGWMWIQIGLGGIFAEGAQAHGISREFIENSRSFYRRGKSLREFQKIKARWIKFWGG